MNVLLGMSGGVDSSVAAVLLLREGHSVTGATMKLWGGVGDSGCCSLGDVQDARRVAQQLDIPHYVMNFTDDFDEHVVAPYVTAHAEGCTPNPCIECNRNVKFVKFLHRARQLGFDAIATGHYARVTHNDDGWTLHRAVDAQKDQSYVLHVLDQDTLSATLLPLGGLTKSEVREIARESGLQTATKRDSQDVCFISATKGGRQAFLGARIPLHAATLHDVHTGALCGNIADVELLTIGQRKGMGGGTAERRYAVEIDVPGRTVFVGGQDDLMTERIALTQQCWVHEPIAPGTRVLAQTSAHGVPFAARFEGDHLVLGTPQRKVSPGQSVVLYDGDVVLGGAIAARVVEGRSQDEKERNDGVKTTTD